MTTIPPEVQAQVDKSFSILTALMAATTAEPPAKGEVIKTLIRQLIEQMGPAILSWILTLLAEKENSSPA